MARAHNDRLRVILQFSWLKADAGDMPLRVNDGRIGRSGANSTEGPIDVFDQMNCSRVETVGTAR
jgi:hypothetical protein